MGSHQKKRRAVRALLWGIAAAHVMEAMKLRARRSQLRSLPSTTRTPSDTEKLSVSAVEGRIDGGTLSAVAAEMEASGAQVIDLVPGDIAAERAMAFLRRVDLDQLRDDPCYAPSGACEAVAVHASVAERMGLDRGVEVLDRGAMVQRTIDAQRYAPHTRTVRVAPELRVAPFGARDRWAELHELVGWTRPYLSLAGVAQGFELVWLALLTAGPWLAPLPGLAAVVAWSAQPALVFGGDVARLPAGTGRGEPGEAGEPGGSEASPEADRGFTPPDLAGASLLRLPRTWLSSLATAAAGLRAALAPVDQPTDAAAPTPGFDGKFEPRRDTCPWCGSTSLDLHVEVPDLLQHKPGTFRLDKCRSCGHVFQNPLLTAEGLDLAYANIYDGAGAETSEYLMAQCEPNFRGRANAVARFTQPSRWLDVGCSLGWFFLVARQVFPETRFDGLDMGETVEEGYRRGWSDAVHKGFFTDLVDSLPSYDVVSMHHYLEHTREPRVELACADKVLEPGGYLMIEVPDPEAPWARRLGRYWWQWGQPQHLHFIPCANLVSELTSMGYEVVSVQRGDPTFGNDLTAGVAMWMQAVSRPVHAPWLPPATPVDRVKRTAAVSALVGLMPVAQVIDEVDKARVKKTDGVSNVYRVVARKAPAPVSEAE